jgi:hypothetical protein
MVIKVRTDTFIDIRCDMCGRYRGFVVREDGKAYDGMRAVCGLDLCEICEAARRSGVWRFVCQGCREQIDGAFEDLRSLLNCAGRAFCVSCRTAFYGRWNLRNGALAGYVRRILTDPLPPPKLGYLMTREEIRAQVEEFEREQVYQNRVRTLSRKNLNRFPSLVNPLGRALGRSGTSGAHQLDHVVPVTLCFSHGVPLDDAASPDNLQVIPWLANASRNNSFFVENVEGWPGWDAAADALGIPIGPRKPPKQCRFTGTEGEPS